MAKMAASCCRLELMDTEEICEWLSNKSGKPFQEEILTAIKDNDLDGEALSAAVGQGPESIKEAIPSLSKRLKLIGAIQVLKASLVSEDSSSHMGSSAPQSTGVSECQSDFDVEHSDEMIDDFILSPTQSATSSSSSTPLCTPTQTKKGSRLVVPGSSSSMLTPASDLISNKKQLPSSTFVLPFFRPDTVKNLKAERIPDRDRRYIVRLLADMVSSTNRNPSLQDCCVPAQELVKVYPFLGDVSDDGKQPWYSWAKFICQRCANSRRSKNNEVDSAEVPKSKRKKTENYMKHQYLEDKDSIILDDVASFNRIIKRIAAELLKPHPNAETLEDLMMQTFPNRRASILGGELALLDVCVKYPLLKKPKHVALEFDRITGLSNSMQQFVKDWSEIWVQAISTVSKSEGYTLTDNDDPSVHGFKMLVKLLTSKKRKDTLAQVLLSAKKGTPHDEIVGLSNQPMIVVLYDVVDRNENMYYIMIEQELILDTRSFDEALYLLVAVHYVFNLEYNSAVHEVLLFLQEFVCQLKSKDKHSAVYTSVTSRLFRESRKISSQ